MIAGFLVALAAAGCYEGAYVLQALEARRAGDGAQLEVSLVARLARRPRWLAGTALSGVGALAQVLALTLAPLTLVQPTLALGLVALLVLARTVLGEPVGPRERVGVAAVVAGVTLVALLAPEHDGGIESAGGVAVLLGVLGAVTLAPYVVRGLDRPRLRVWSAASGDAAAAIALKLLADALDAGRWLAAAAWGATAAVAGLLALNAEMSALQRLPATHIAPLVLAAQVVIPVAAAPLVLGEAWSSSTAGGVALALGVGLVAAGAALLGSSVSVSSVLAVGRGTAVVDRREDDLGG